LLGFLVGVTIAAHKYDLNSTAPFQTSDILDLHPIVKHSIPVSAEAKGLVETGKLQFAEVITIVLNCGPLHCGCNIKVLGSQVSIQPLHCNHSWGCISRHIMQFS